MIDEKLNFNEHATYFCNKTSKKIQAVARIFARRKLEEINSKKTFNECISSISIWILTISLDEPQSKTLNNRINGLHKRVLRLVYCDCSSIFSETSIKMTLSETSRH